jgi:uncharacterized damage-inducible protein DinB
VFTAQVLREIHDRAHRNLSALLDHCRLLDAGQLDRELDGFGYPTVRLQLHHAIGAQRYWLGVLQGRIDADDDDHVFPTVAALAALRATVYAATDAYLRDATPAEVNTARPMLTLGGRTKVLTPAHVVLRTQTHLYHHQGQVTAMCRLLGKPCQGLDYPIE